MPSVKVMKADLSVEGDAHDDQKSQSSSVGKRIQKITNIFAKKKKTKKSAGEKSSKSSSSTKKKRFSSKKKESKTGDLPPKASKAEEPTPVEDIKNDKKEAEPASSPAPEEDKPVVLETHYYEAEPQTETDDDEDDCHYSAPAALGLKDGVVAEPSPEDDAREEESPEKKESPAEPREILEATDDKTNAENESEESSAGEEATDQLLPSFFCGLISCLLFNDTPPSCVPSCGPSNVQDFQDDSSLMNDNKKQEAKTMDKPMEAVDGPAEEAKPEAETPVEATEESGKTPEAQKDALKEETEIPVDTPAETLEAAKVEDADVNESELQTDYLVLEKQPTPSGMTNEDETGAKAAVATIKVETVGKYSVDETQAEDVAKDLQEAEAEEPSALTEQREDPASEKKTETPEPQVVQKKKLTRRQAQKREAERLRHKRRHFKNLQSQTGRDEIERSRQNDDLSSKKSEDTTFDLMGNSFDSVGGSETETIDGMIQEALDRIQRARDYVDLSLQPSMSGAAE